MMGTLTTLSAQPQISFVRDTAEAVNLGKHPQSTKPVMYEVIIKNTGTEPLKIIGYDTDCICNRCKKIPKKPIKPQQSVTIQYYYDVSKLGEFDKWLRFDTNDPKQPHAFLRLMGVVE